MASIIDTYPGTADSAQRKIFMANGRHWVFYTDGTNGVYKTSLDGVTWSNKSIFRTGIYRLNGVEFAIWFDGTYFHYAYSPYAVTQQPIYYRRGTPNANGTISWSAAEQTAVAAVQMIWYRILSISVDSDGHIWIGYIYVSFSGTADFYVTKSGNNNGTWGTTPSGFPYKFGDFSGGNLIILPLASSEMLAVIYGFPRLYAKKWDGSTWSGYMSVDTSTKMGSTVPNVVSAIILSNNAHVILANGKVGHYKWTYSSDSWSSGTIIYSNADWAVLTILSTNLYCFIAPNYPDHQHIFYKKFNGSSWDANPTDWIIEETFCGNNCFTCSYNGVSLVYYPSSSNTLKYAYLSFVTMDSISGITSREAMAHGILEAGPYTKRGFCWNTTGEPTIADNKVEEEGSFGSGSYSLEMTGLTTNTHYFVKAYAYEGGILKYSMDQVEFDTLYIYAPTVITYNPINVTSESARLRGILEHDGQAETCEVRWGWGESSEEDIDDYDNVTEWEGEYEEGAMPYLDIEDLDDGHTYYFRCQMRNIEGAGMGEEKSFTAGDLLVGAVAPRNLESRWAILRGEILGTAESCDCRGFVWGRFSQSNPGDVHPSEAGYEHYWLEEGEFEVGLFEHKVFDLAPGTKYYFRDVAHNEMQGWAYA
jgi:hypothetical protein